MSAYRQFRKGEHAKYYVVSQAPIRGHYVVTPYRSKPETRPGEVVVSGAKHHYKLNKNGYAVTRHKPKETMKKKRPAPKSGFGLFMPSRGFRF